MSQDKLREAATAFLAHYIEMVNSGDCGNWDPEEEEHVIALRAALAQPEPKAEGRDAGLPYTVTQDGQWTILHTTGGGAETTLSLTRDQANDLAEQLTAFPCPECGNEVRGQDGYLSCECPAPALGGTQ